MLAMNDEKLVNIVILIFVLAIAGIARLIKWASEKASQARQKSEMAYHQRHAQEQKPEPIPRLKGFGFGSTQEAATTPRSTATPRGAARHTPQRFTPPQPQVLPQEQIESRQTPPQFQMTWDLEEMFQRDSQREEELLQMKQQVLKLRQKLQQVQAAKPVAPVEDTRVYSKVAPPAPPMPGMAATNYAGNAEYGVIALNFAEPEKLRQAIVAMEVLLPPVSIRQND